MPADATLLGLRESAYFVEHQFSGKIGIVGHHITSSYYTYST